MSQSFANVLRFEGFTLDPARATLSNSTGEIKLRPKSFDVLCYLVTKAGLPVSKDELIEAVWGKAAVSDESIARCISDIRAALGDDDGRIVTTLPRRGYKFSASLTDPAGQPVAQRERGDETVSVAVLAFLNLSGDPEANHFANGMVEEVITAIGRMRPFHVISAYSGLGYKGDPSDFKQVGREFGVRHLLKGSAQRVGHRIRVACQLYNVETAAQLWGERFEGYADRVFDLQDEVVARVANTIWQEIVQSEFESKRLAQGDSLTSYDHYLKGMVLYHRNSLESILQSITEWRRSAAANSDFAMPHAMLALATLRLFHFGHIPPLQDLQEAGCSADLALILAPNNCAVLGCASIASLLLKREVEQAVFLAERAIAVSPRFAFGWASLGWAKAYSGEADAAKTALDRAILLDPFNRVILDTSLIARIMIATLQDRTDEKQDAAQRLLALAPDNFHGLEALCDVAIVEGRRDDAHVLAARIKSLYPAFRELYAVRMAERILRNPKHSAAFAASLTRMIAVLDAAP